MEMAHGWRRWSVKLHLALQVLLLASCASADDDHGVTFLYPNATTHPELMTMYYLDTANVTYISPFKTPLLYTFCNDGKSFIRVQDAAPLNGSTYVFLNFSSSTTCYFNLRPGTEVGHGRNGDHFTLSPDVLSQTTVGLPQPSSTSTESSTSTSSGTSSSTTASSSSAAAGSSSSDSAGLSAGAKAGIGVGVAIGVIGLACVVGFLVMRRRRQQHGGVGVTGATYEKDGNDIKVPYQGGQDGLKPDPSQHSSGASPYSEVEGSRHWPAAELSGVLPQEMEVEQRRHELPG